MRYKLVIFDLDGTLMDTVEDLGNAVNHAMRSHGHPVHDIPSYKARVGHGIRNLVKNALPEALREDESEVDSCLKAFVEYYTENIDRCTRPYKGICALIDALSAAGIKLAVASNKFQTGTETLIHKFFPNTQFVDILGNRPGAPLKPDPEIVFDILRKAGMSEDDSSCVAFVGDSATDMKTGHNAGAVSVGVSWGFRPRTDLEAAGADFIADSPARLQEILLV